MPKSNAEARVANNTRTRGLACWAIATPDIISAGAGECRAWRCRLGEVGYIDDMSIKACREEIDAA